MNAPASGYEHIEVERHGPVTLVRLNRPAVRNALHPAAHFECAAAFDAFAADPDQWVAVVTGAGDKAFSAGHDLKFQAGGGEITMPPSGFAGLATRFDLAKPVVAAVNGLALGGGFETALACDLVVAAETASFGLPEPRVGLAALAGGLHRLPRAVGVKRAMDIVLTCRRIDAAEGLALGFVNRVVPDGQAVDAALALARDIARGSPSALRAAKQAMMHGLDRPLPDALTAQWGLPEVRALRMSRDAVEGPKAFAEKREPIWTGR